MRAIFLLTVGVGCTTTTTTENLADGPSADVAPGSDAPDPDDPDACGDAGPQQSYACTQVIGFSQTSNWYGGEPTPRFEATPGIDGSRWMLRWHGGAGVESWADPTYEGWNDAAAATQVVSPCAAPVERVVLTISSNVYTDQSTPEQWAGEIRNAIATIKSKLPSATRIVLQPVVGGTAMQACDTRASENQPSIVAAIQLVVDGTTVVRGATPIVTDCAMFADAKGHLSTAGASFIAGVVGGCYAN